MRLDVDGPQQVVLGKETTYVVKWQNVSSQPIASADIRVSFPVDFTMTNAQPKPAENGLVWHLGAIPIGGRGALLLHGTFTGALGTKTAIQAVSTYRPGSLTSDFETLATRELEYTGTVLNGSIDVPQKVLPGDHLRIVYTIQHLGLAPMKQIEARITLPRGFVRDVASSSSDVDEHTIRIPLGDIAAGSTTTVAVSGTFASGHSGEASIHAEVGRIGIDGSFQPAQRADASFAVLSGDLNVKLVVNGSDADRAIDVGDVLRVAIGYENTANEHIKDVSIQFMLQPIFASGTNPLSRPTQSNKSTFVDWSRFEDAASGTVRENTVTWGKAHIGVLERLPPQQDGTIEFALPSIARASESGILGFQAVAEAKMKFVGTTEVNRTVATAPITFRFRTDATLTAEARYFSEEGVPLGNGPLPPVVGQTTRYRIFWDITKSIHELHTIRVSATLAKHVAWSGKFTSSAGDVTYDATNKRVSWTLNRMPNDVQDVHATFDLELTPSIFDAGRFGDLLNETRFETVDADIGEQIVRNKPPLTTDLQNDEAAKSKGVVRKS